MKCRQATKNGLHATSTGQYSRWFRSLLWTSQWILIACIVHLQHTHTNWLTMPTCVHAVLLAINLFNHLLAQARSRMMQHSLVYLLIMQLFYGPVMEGLLRLHGHGLSFKLKLWASRKNLCYVLAACHLCTALTWSKPDVTLHNFCCLWLTAASVSCGCQTCSNLSGSTWVAMHGANALNLSSFAPGLFHTDTKVW